MTGEKPRIRLMGDSMGDGEGNHFIVRYDESNRPNYFEINGVPVDEAEYRKVRSISEIRTLKPGKIDGAEIDLVINHGLPLAGSPIVEALNDMGDLAERIVQMFEAHCVRQYPANE